MNASTPRPINVLIVGTGMYVCGRSTAGHGTVLPAVMQAHQAGIVGELLVASKHGGSFATFGAKLDSLNELLGTQIGYRRYPSDDSTASEGYRDALNDLPDPGVVIIAVPDHLHEEVAQAAIAAGKHVLVVKPLAPTVASATRLIDAAERAGVYGAVEFHKRWDLANLKLRDVLKQGGIGDPLYFHVEYSQRKVIPTQVFQAWVDRTSIFQYLGVHYADIIYFATGAKPRRLLAVGQRNWLAAQGVNAYDSIEVLIEWDKGFVSTLLTNWIDPNNNAAMSHQMIKVVGTKGRLESDQTARGIEIVADANGIEVPNPYFCQLYANPDRGGMEYRGYGIDSVTQFLKDAMEIVHGRARPADFEGRRPTFRDSLVSTSIVEAANLSLEKGGQWVTFGDGLQPVAG